MQPEERQKPILWIVDTSGEDHVTIDNEYWTFPQTSGASIGILSPLISESTLDDPGQSLLTTLNAIGYSANRLEQINPTNWLEYDIIFAVQPDATTGYDCTTKNAN